MYGLQDDINDLERRIKEFNKILDYISKYGRCFSCGAPRVISEFRAGEFDFRPENLCKKCGMFINTPSVMAPDGADMCIDCSYVEEERGAGGRFADELPEADYYGEAE
jgi:RNA polymerase-binding transcription factor DksA